MTKKQYDRESREANKLIKRLRRLTGSAIADYRMIEDGDHVMVAMSGGKDSFALLDILLMLRSAAPVDFRITAVNLDQKQPGFPDHILPAYLESRGVDYRIVEQDTYSVVKRVIPEGQTTCSLCSRLRRGVLYRTAVELGATKIALGHHRDDIMETLFLNMFYGGTIKGMPPKLVSDDGRNVVIRPLAYCKEADLAALAAHRRYPLIPCDLCGSQPDLQRQVIKDMLRSWEKTHPGRVETIFRSMANIIPSHMMDSKLYPFSDIAADGVPNPDGDTAFDDDGAPYEAVLAQLGDGDDEETRRRRENQLKKIRELQTLPLAEGALEKLLG
jgi:tRNA 2-thiocytidine biosynthesis protein TtcA